MTRMAYDFNDMDRDQGGAAIVDALRGAAHVWAESAPFEDPAQLETKSPLPLEFFDQIQMRLTGLWLMKHLLPAQGLAVLHGHPGSGKTFLALDWSMHIALGREWQGRKVKQGLVVYLCAEGVTGLRNRIEAFRRHHNVSAAPFALIPTGIDMQAPDADVNRLIEAVRAAETHYGEQAGLVVIDTVSKTFGAGKENTDDMVTYVANGQRVANEFECLTMAVHHRPKDAESEDPRGHSSLKGGAETVLLVEAGETKKVRVSKQKDGEDGLEMLFKLRVVELGQDEDGEPVTSCVVEPTDLDLTTPKDTPEAKASKLPDNVKRVLQVLDDTATASGIYPPSDIPDTQINRMKVGKVVDLEVWRTNYAQTAGQDPDSKPDTVSKSFRRALTRLQNDGIVAVWGACAWRTWTVRTQPDTGSDINSFRSGQPGQKGSPLKGGTPALSGSLSGVPASHVRGNSNWRSNPLLNPSAVVDERPSYPDDGPDDWEFE